MKTTHWPNEHKNNSHQSLEIPKTPKQVSMSLIPKLTQNWHNRSPWHRQTSCQRPTLTATPTTGEPHPHPHQGQITPMGTQTILEMITNPPTDLPRHQQWINKPITQTTPADPKPYNPDHKGTPKPKMTPTWKVDPVNPLNAYWKELPSLDHLPWHLHSTPWQERALSAEVSP